MRDVKEIEKYRAGAGVLIASISLCAFNAFGLAVWALNRPDRLRTVVSFAALNIAWLLIAYSLREGGSIIAMLKRHISHNIWPGYDLIWMLDKEENLDWRVERRDDRHPELNTSTYCIYLKLGGWGGKRAKIVKMVNMYETKDVGPALSVGAGKILVSYCDGSRYVLFGVLEISEFLGVIHVAWLNEYELARIEPVLAWKLKTANLLIGENKIAAQKTDAQLRETEAALETARAESEHYRAVAETAMDVLVHSLNFIIRSSRLKSTVEGRGLREYLSEKIPDVARALKATSQARLERPPAEL